VSSLPSQQPYLIRALYDWCLDNMFTPQLAIAVDQYTVVPRSYVKDGEIVINIGSNAVKNLHIGNDFISCTGRFNGVAFDIQVPVSSVLGIFARENGHGLMFSDRHQFPKEPLPTSDALVVDTAPVTPSKSHLTIVK
jgi:stringent starvation protein B